MRVYAISLEKGGTGKSSVAVNLAVAFQQRGQRVLLIDLDAQGHASHWLGVDSRHSRSEDSILGVIRGRPLGEGAIATEEGVAVVPANPEMAGLPVALASAPNNGLFSLRAAVAQMATRGAPFDVIVCDLPPARSPILATALAAATRCVAPVQPEDLVLQALADLSESVSYAQQVNPSLPDVSVLRNRYAPRSAVDMVYDEELRTKYGAQLLQTIIPMRAAVRFDRCIRRFVRAGWSEHTLIASSPSLLPARRRRRLSIAKGGRGRQPLLGSIIRPSLAWLRERRSSWPQRLRYGRAGSPRSSRASSTPAPA